MGMRFLLQAVIVFAQGTIKNPKSLAKERKYLVQARDLLAQLVEGIDAPAAVGGRTRPAQTRG